MIQNNNRSPRVQPFTDEQRIMDHDGQAIDIQPLVLLGTEKYLKHDDPNTYLSRGFLLFKYIGKYFGWEDEDFVVGIY